MLAGKGFPHRLLRGRRARLSRPHNLLQPALARASYTPESLGIIFRFALLVLEVHLRGPLTAQRTCHQPGLRHRRLPERREAGCARSPGALPRGSPDRGQGTCPASRTPMTRISTPAAPAAHSSAASNRPRQFDDRLKVEPVADVLGRGTGAQGIR
jgi:hypothetical protein